MKLDGKHDQSEELIRNYQLMYKIINNEAPGYLTNLLPNRVGEQTHYQLRNNQNFEIPFSRLCSYENLYFPSTLRLWNDLGLSRETHHLDRNLSVK